MSNETKNNEVRRLVWHRRDLRLHDNEIYSNLVLNTKNGGGIEKGHGEGEQNHKVIKCISLFIFDKQYFEPQPSIIKGSGYDTVWCGPHASQALIEAVTTLRTNLQNIGGELIVRQGNPIEIIPPLVQELGITEIYYNEEPGTYEKKVVTDLLTHYLYHDFDHYNDPNKQPIKIVSKSGYTLYHPNDLPIDPNKWDQLAHPKNKTKKKKGKNATKNKGGGSSRPSSSSSDDNQRYDLVDVSSDRFKGMCKIMGDFRKAARTATQVRKPLLPPTSITLPKCCVNNNDFDFGCIPTLEQLVKPLSNLERSILGMDQSVIQLIVQSALNNRKVNDKNNFVGEDTALQRIESFLNEGAATADRSRADVSSNNSSRLSIHFALGTLSPRYVYWKANEAGEGCKWLMSHLEMRDFFLYTTYANGPKLFHQGGIPVGKEKKNIKWTNPKNDHGKWYRWATGKTHLPMVDAAMLELMNTGYCSNRVRQNVASVLTKDLQIDWRAGAEWFQFLLEDHCVGANFGNWLYFSGVGPDPKNRHFRTISQSLRYDVDGTYVKKWNPTLLNIQNMEAVFRPWDFDVPGFDNPIVDPLTQFTYDDLKRLEETNKLIN